MNHVDGYIHLKGIIHKDLLEQMYSNMNDTQMNYTGMRSAIDQLIKIKINPVLNWDADYIKLRVSDNNNSVDASAFHRDIFNQTTVCDSSCRCENESQCRIPITTRLS